MHCKNTVLEMIHCNKLVSSGPCATVAFSSFDADDTHYSFSVLYTRGGRFCKFFLSVSATPPPPFSSLHLIFYVIVFCEVHVFVCEYFFVL